jgi:hypothetical protein
MSAPVWTKLLQFFPTLLKGNSGAAPAVDWSAGAVQSITLNAATVTPTFAPTVGGASLALVVTQDGTGGRAVVWPAAVSWIGGTPPILLSGASQTTLVYFYWDGTTYWGTVGTAATPSSIIPWTPVAAGTALAASLAKPNLACDSSGAQSTITLPTAVQMAKSDGFEFTIKATGNMAAPVVVAAGAGTTLELLNAPGTFGASTWMPIEGQAVTFKYDLATTTFKARVAFVGSAAEGTSQYNAGWYAKTDVYWDPQAGLDSDTGAVGHPLRTMAEIVRRYGGPEPFLPFGQSLTVHQLTAQTVNVDVYYFNPRMTGGGAFAILGTTPNRGAAFSPTTVTAKVQTSVGNALQLTGALPAGLAVGDIVHNITKDSYAKVQAIGGGTATMEQPYAAAGVTTISPVPTLVQDNLWANTDSYQAMIPVLSNFTSLAPSDGSASNPGGAVSVFWLQGLLIPDQSGTAGDSILSIRPLGPSFIASLCTFQTAVALDGLLGNFTALIASTMLSFVYLGSVVSVVGGSVGNFISIYGGACALDGDTIFAHSIELFGATHLNIGAIQLLAAASLVIQENGAAIILHTFLVTETTNALLWGPGQCAVKGA